MNNIKTNSVLFIGIDTKVFDILRLDKRIELKGVNFIPDLLNHRTLNPIDSLFRYLYFIHIHNYPLIIQKFVLFFLNLSINYSSDLYRRFYQYLRALIDTDMPVIDLEKETQVKNFVNKNDIGVFVISNWWILPDEVINLPKYKTVNIHPALLPQYRGSLPTLWSLKNHDSITAVTFMIINSKIDGGKIIAQHIVPISPADDAITLEDKCDKIIKKNFINDLINYLEGNIKLMNQDESKASVTAKYHPYMKIDWSNEKTTDIINKVLLYPHLWPLDRCYTMLNQKKIQIKNATSIKSLRMLNPGSYKINKFSVEIEGIDGLVVAQLFRDISFFDSINLLLQKNKFLN
ncbi:hypothetical protein KBC89_04355 [Candidatus Woesebacteria bacterium]|nr:hypothetical protein [Candidatus Woesebacteria bacterium]